MIAVSDKSEPEPSEAIDWEMGRSVVGSNTWMVPVELTMIALERVKRAGEAETAVREKKKRKVEKNVCNAAAMGWCIQHGVQRTA
jgi:hypothetical protein